MPPLLFIVSLTTCAGLSGVFDGQDLAPAMGDCKRKMQSDLNNFPVYNTVDNLFCLLTHYLLLYWFDFVVRIALLN
jgi:hypothetical protein